MVFEEAQTQGADGNLPSDWRELIKPKRKPRWDEEERNAE